MKSLLAAIARLITGANARWVGCAPEIRQRVYFANHTSNLDALVIWASLPSPIRALTRPVARARLLDKKQIASVFGQQNF